MANLCPSNGHRKECIKSKQQNSHYAATRRDIEHRFRVCLAAAAGRQIRHKKLGYWNAITNITSYHPAVTLLPFFKRKIFTSLLCRVPLPSAFVCFSAQLLPAVLAPLSGSAGPWKTGASGYSFLQAGAHCFTQHPAAPGAIQLFLTASVESCANGS